MVANTQTIVELGAIPSASHHLPLISGDPPSPRDSDPRISTVPLDQSRGLPIELPSAHNPFNWPTARGTPDYIPRETNIDRADRPLGSNGGEFVFLVFMLSGVQIVGTSNVLWRSTFGRLTDKVFKYKIGGHW